MLDIGCGRAPLADRVRGLGLDYVGVDVDADALAEVGRRGFEAHQLDLGATREELSSSLRAIVGERSLSAVLAVDVLEHLVEPDRVLNALRDLPADDGAWSLIVSIPNVTHVDIASKLLLGRWDLTEFGLLDDTHLRFFSERLLNELFRATGWREADAADAQSPASDQLFPVDSPLVRPGAPAHELLRHLSAQSHPHWATYQFVRRFSPADVPDSGHRWAVERESDEERVFASVLLRPSEAGDPDHTRLLKDLEAQTSQDFETIVCEDGWNSGIAAAQGRYLCFPDGSVRLSSRWIEAFRSPRELAGHVLKANVVSVSPRRLTANGGVDSLIASGKPVPVNPLDPLLPYRPGPTVLSAYAVPLEAARTTGIRFEHEHGAASPAVFLSRAAAALRRGIGGRRDGRGLESREARRQCGPRLRGGRAGWRSPDPARRIGDAHLCPATVQMAADEAAEGHETDRQKAEALTSPGDCFGSGAANESVVAVSVLDPAPRRPLNLPGPAARRCLRSTTTSSSDRRAAASISNSIVEALLAMQDQLQELRLCPNVHVDRVIGRLQIACLADRLFLGWRLLRDKSRPFLVVLAA